MPANSITPFTQPTTQEERTLLLSWAMRPSAALGRDIIEEVIASIDVLLIKPRPSMLATKKGFPTTLESNIYRYKLEAIRIFISDLDRTAEGAFRLRAARLYLDVIHTNFQGWSDGSGVQKWLRLKFTGRTATKCQVADRELRNLFFSIQGSMVESGVHDSHFSDRPTPSASWRHVSLEQVERNNRNALRRLRAVESRIEIGGRTLRSAGLTPMADSSRLTAEQALSRLEDMDRELEVFRSKIANSAARVGAAGLFPPDVVRDFHNSREQDPPLSGGSGL